MDTSMYNFCEQHHREASESRIPRLLVVTVDTHRMGLQVPVWGIDHQYWDIEISFLENRRAQGIRFLGLPPSPTIIVH